MTAGFQVLDGLAHRQEPESQAVGVVTTSRHDLLLVFDQVAEGQKGPLEKYFLFDGKFQEVKCAYEILEFDVALEWNAMLSPVVYFFGEEAEGVHGDEVEVSLE